MTRRCKRQLSPSTAYVDQRAPLLGSGVIGIHLISEEFEYFEENVIRDGSDWVQLAYTDQA